MTYPSLRTYPVAVRHDVRPRLSFLLPALALLVGALGLFAAAPAGAHTFSTPSGVTVSPQNEALAVSWSKPSISHSQFWGIPIQYRVKQPQGQWQSGGYVFGSQCHVNNGSGCSVTITGLTNGTTYEVRVGIRTGSNHDHYSAAVDGTPVGATTTPSAPIWSATLTAKDLGGGDFGCRDTSSGNECSSTSILTKDEFVHGTPSVTYTFTSIQEVAFGSIVVTVDKDVRTVVSGLNFCVGSTALAFSSASVASGGKSFTWTGTSLSWSADDVIPVSIGSSCAGTTPTLSTDATLSGLTATSNTSSTGTFGALTLAPAFAAATTSYTASVANSITHVKLTPTVNHSAASVEVGKQGQTLTAVSSGTASAAIALAEGANPITVKVTAEDGTSTQTYTVTVTRAASTAVPQNVTLTPVAHNGAPALVLNLGVLPAGHAERYQLRVKTTNAWLARGSVNSKPSGVTVSPLAVKADGSTDYRATGVTAGTTYELRAHYVTAGNVVVDASSAVVEATAWTVPGAPTSVNAAAGDASLSVSWAAPTSAGGAGASITGYKVRWRQKDANPNTQGNQPGAWNNNNGVDADDSTARTHAISSLTNGAVYEVEVRALNGINPGSAWSAAGEGTPASTAPTTSTDATLSGLTATSSTSSTGTFGALTLAPAFAKATEAYTTTTLTGHRWVKVQPSASDNGATVQVGKAGDLRDLSADGQSHVIALTAIETEIQVVVTAEDGMTTKTYTVTVTTTPVVSYSKAVYELREAGDNTVVVTVNINPPLAQASTVRVIAASQGSTADLTDDYTVASGLNANWELALSAGATSASFTLQGVADETTEGPEKILLGFQPVGSPPYGFFRRSRVTVNIVDNSLTPAMTCDGIWCATLTAKKTLHDINGNHEFGCRNDQTGNECSTTSILTDDDFEYGSPAVTYSLTQIRDTSARFLIVQFDKAVRTALAGLNFCVGTNAYAISSADWSLGNAKPNWTVDVSWSEGGTASLAIGFGSDCSSSQPLASTDATLSGLTATSSTSSTGTFTSLGIGTFAAATTSYTASVANSITHVKLTPTVNHSAASVEVGKQGQTLTAVSSGTASAAIALAEGANPITVKVTAEDGTSTQTYTVTVTRAASTAVPQNVTLTPVAHNGAPALVLNLGVLPAGHAERYQLRVKTTNAWLARGSVNSKPSGVTVSPLAVKADGSTDYRATGVTAGTTYELRAHYVTAGNVVVDASSAVVEATAWTVPGAPTSVNAAAGDASLSVSWAAPTSAGGAGASITGYKVRWRQKDANPNTQGNQPGAWNNNNGVDADDSTARTHAISSLTNGAVYEVEVRALNGINPGSAWSAAGEGTPASTAPTTSTDATLSGLTATKATSSSGPFTSLTFTPAFVAATERYTANVANSITHVKLRPTVNHSAASVEVGKQGSLQSVSSGTASQAVALDLGENVIFAKVTAENTNIVSYYRITVTRAAPATPTVTLSATPNPVAEGTAQTVVRATLSSALSSDVSIPATLTRGSAEAADISGSITAFQFPQGSTTADFIVGINQDADADDETFTVALGNLPAGVAAGTATSVTVTITDDDTPATSTVTLSASPNPVGEGETVVVKATLSQALSGAVTIPVTTTRLTSESGDHGTLSSITVASGQTSGEGEIATNEDADVDDETFTVALGSPLPSAVAAGSTKSVEIAIRDDETAPPPTVLTLRANNRNPAEGTVVTVTAALNHPAPESGTVVTLEAGGTASGLGVDYLLPVKTLLITGRTRSIELPVDIARDDVHDPGETLVLTATSDAPALTSNRLTLTIADRAASAPSVSLSATTPVNERDPVTVTAALTHALASDVTIPIELRPGTAEAGDYGTTLKSITIRGGATTGTGQIGTNRDADTDDDTFWVELGTLPASVTVGSPSSVLVTIKDYSRPVGTPTVTLSATTPVNEGSDVTVTARLSSSVSGGVTIPLTLSNGSAEDGDYGTLASIAIAGGQTEGTGTITTYQDADFDDETFTVALGTLPASVQAGAVRSVEVTIADDDTRPKPAVTLSASPNPVREGTSVTVTAELSHALAGAVTIPVSLTPVTAETSDYGRLTSIRIPADQLSGEGTVATRQDADTDDEMFTVALGTLPASVQAGSPNSVDVTIADDDGGGTDSPTKVTLKASRNPVPEGATVTLTAELDGPAPAGGVKVGFSAFDGSAFAGVDYTLSPRSECCDNATADIPIAEGARVATATLTVLADGEAEGAETIEIEATANTADYTVGFATITLTIPASPASKAQAQALPEGLGTPFPTPFNAEVTVPFALSEAGAVHLAVYNLMGQPVRVLTAGWLAAGMHRVRWDGRTDAGAEASSGVYLVVLQTGAAVQTAKLALIR